MLKLKKYNGYALFGFLSGLSLCSGPFSDHSLTGKRKNGLIKPLLIK